MDWTPTVAVVVPLPRRAVLTGDEEISLRHLEHHLAAYDRFFIAERGTRFERPGFGVVEFPSRFFGSARAHARLQLSEAFYAAFARYDYILMYHLDALVLSDRLTEWCRSGFDYIGAPWLHCDDSPWVSRPRVGNGGFALMRTASFLNVIRSDGRGCDPDAYWREFCATSSRRQQWVNLPKRYLKRLHAFNNVRWEMRRWPYRRDGLGNSDYFWSDEAVKYWPSFKVAPVEEGLRFAFEVAPRWCYEQIGNQMPFGCHAWPRYDRAFWEPHLLK